jgi:hypothetical protein
MRHIRNANLLTKAYEKTGNIKYLELKYQRERTERETDEVVPGGVVGLTVVRSGYAGNTTLPAEVAK